MGFHSFHSVKPRWESDIMGLILSYMYMNISNQAIVTRWGALYKQHRCFFPFALAVRWSALRAVFLSGATELASHKSPCPYFLIQFFSSSDISSCMYASDWWPCATHIAMSVPEKEMMYAKLNSVFHNAPSPDLPSWQPRARFPAPLYLSIKPPVMSQRTVGGARGAYRGCRSVYLGLAVPTSDGGSHLTKGNVVNVD